MRWQKITVTVRKWSVFECDRTCMHARGRSLFVLPGKLTICLSILQIETYNYLPYISVRTLTLHYITVVLSKITMYKVIYHCCCNFFSQLNFYVKNGLDLLTKSDFSSCKFADRWVTGYYVFPENWLILNTTYIGWHKKLSTFNKILSIGVLLQWILNHVIVIIII